MKKLVGYVVRHLGCGVFGDDLCYVGGPATGDSNTGLVFTSDRAKVWVWKARGGACEWVDERGRALHCNEAFKARSYRIIPIVRRS